MYIPSHFLLTDEQEIKRLIRSSSFATIVADDDGIPIGAHLLTELLEGTSTGGGADSGFTIVGHMARSNPLWQAAANASEVLAIFLGPHCYISPTWYEKPSVPTWDYSAVHLYGAFRIVDDHDELYELLRRLVASNERGSSKPFALTDLPREQVDGMMKGIVGFEIVPSRIEAVAKLSQNQREADRKSVVAHLSDRPDEASRRVAEAMTRIGTAHREDE